jgi:hypothetical protein
MILKIGKIIVLGFVDDTSTLNYSAKSFGAGAALSWDGLKGQYQNQFVKVNDSISQILKFGRGTYLQFFWV